MDGTEFTLKVIMMISTIVLFAYGIYQGYDTLELFTYNTYFIALILYLIKINLLG